MLKYILVAALALSLRAGAQPLSPQTTCKAGTDCPYAIAVQSAAVTGSSVTINSSADCPQATLAGRGGAGLVVAAGTLAATLVPYVSADGTNWTATKFSDAAGTLTADLVLTNPNSASLTAIVISGGARYVRVCSDSYTSGSAAAYIVATALARGSGGSGGGGSGLTHPQVMARAGSNY